MIIYAFYYHILYYCLILLYIRYKGDTDFVFVVLLLFGKILSNPIKILEKRSTYS